MSSVCRVCLVRDVKMYFIKNIQLLDIFMKLTSSELNTDGRPNTICYICHSQLLRCCRFSEMARRSERLFRALFPDGTEVIQNHTIQNLVSMQNLSVTVAFKDEYTNEKIKYLSVKKENPEEKTVKIEKKTHVGNEIGNMESLKQSKIISKKIHKNVYECKVCSKKFLAKLELVKHMKQYPTDKSYTCYKCNKSFHKQSHLDNHMKSHPEEKPYICDRCSKQFKHESRLKKHFKKVHIGEKAYACELCEKKFFENCYLREHMRTHTGEKAFACDKCQMSFVHRNSLTRHVINVHTRVKPFSCTSCDMTFAFKWGLIIHMRMHTGEKPYTCSICEVKFAYKDKLRHHMKIHSGEKTYKCDKCGKSYSRKDTFNKHMILCNARPVQEFELQR